MVIMIATLRNSSQTLLSSSILALHSSAITSSRDFLQRRGLTCVYRQFQANPMNLNYQKQWLPLLAVWYAHIFVAVGSYLLLIGYSQFVRSMPFFKTTLIANSSLSHQWALMHSGPHFSRC